MRAKLLNIVIFLFLVFIVVILSLIILKPVFNVGFTADEWTQIIYYKVYKLNPLELWKIRGPYTTTQAYFIGILVDFFGLDIHAIQVVNVCLKILATLSIYPLILYTFRNRLLAFLTTVLYGINYTTAKSLEYPVKGGDYLGILFMSLFLIVYVYMVRKSTVSLKWIFLLGFLFLLTLMGSPIRMYPLPIFIIFIEIYIFATKPSFFTLKSSLLRVLAVYLIPVTIYFYKPSVITAYFVGFPYLYLKVLEGNFYLLAVPFQGISHSILTDKQFWWIFNPSKTTKFMYYFFSLPLRLSILYAMFIFPAIKLVSIKRPGKLYSSLFVSAIFTLSVYFFGAHYDKINTYLKLPFNFASLFSTAFGAFILGITLILYRQWRETASKNSILLPSFIGTFFSFVFVTLTWLFGAAIVGTFGAGGQQYYLVIASLGTSLFIASIVTLFYNKFKKINILPQLFVFISIILFFEISIDDNYSYFTSLNQYRKGFAEQETIQKAAKEKIKIESNHEPFLVYLDTSSDLQNSGFYERAILTNFGWFMPLQDGKIVDGCIGLLYDTTINLKDIVHFENGKPVLVYKSVCIEKASINYQIIVSYKPKNFYAYELKGFELIDIKEDVLKELNIK